MYRVNATQIKHKQWQDKDYSILYKKMTKQFQISSYQCHMYWPHGGVIDRYLRQIVLWTIPDEAPSSLESFYPHETQVSIYHNQGVMDSLSRSPISF